MFELNRRALLRSGLLLSTGNILLKSPFAAAQALFGGAAQAGNGGRTHTMTAVDLAPRERLLFDFNWRFFQGHGCDPARDLGLGFRGTSIRRAGLNSLWQSSMTRDGGL